MCAGSKFLRHMCRKLPLFPLVKLHPGVSILGKTIILLFSVGEISWLSKGKATIMTSSSKLFPMFIALAKRTITINVFIYCWCSVPSCWPALLAWAFKCSSWHRLPVWKLLSLWCAALGSVSVNLFWSAFQHFQCSPQAWADPSGQCVPARSWLLPDWFSCCLTFPHRVCICLIWRYRPDWGSRRRSIVLGTAHVSPLPHLFPQG